MSLIEDIQRGEASPFAEDFIYGGVVLVLQKKREKTGKEIEDALNEIYSDWQPDPDEMVWG